MMAPYCGAQEQIPSPQFLLSILEMSFRHNVIDGP